MDSEFEVALGTAGLTLRQATFDTNLLRFFRQGEFTTPFYDAGSENPWRIPYFADTLRRELGTMAGKPSDLLNTGGRLAGFGTRRTLVGDPLAAELAAAEKPGALRAMLEQMAAAKQLDGKIPNLGAVPADVQSAAALVLSVLPRSLDYRKAALRDLGDLALAYNLLSRPNAASTQGTSFDALLRVYRKVDVRYLGAGGHDLLLAAQIAATKLGAVPSSTSYDVEIPTIWGWIRLTGGGKTVHGNRATLLIIDTGGDDTYLGCPSTSSAANWASVVLDSDGNDQYLSAEALSKSEIAKFGPRSAGSLKPGPGGALLGFCALIDANGNDVYRSHLPGLGSGRLGVAALLDKEGRDEYDAYQDSQGFGMFGAGILEDLAGDDRYTGFTQVQGIGQTMGVGMLADRGGNDQYVANDTEIDFGSPQSAQHNVSMAQGAGNGRRGDYLDGHSLAGGVGVLYDAAGNDGYRCGVFGQGVGYWEGVGLLLDSSGDDTYHGQWYVQGASAHFAIGYLEDEAGNDRYTAPMNMAQGAGHDFSAGMLLDRAGDDQYRAPNLSLGAGNANGLGLFVDMMGQDSYESIGVTLGRAAESPKGSLRTRALCLGVFMDLGGQDTYPGAANWAINSARIANWTDKGLSPGESQVGIFWDR